MNGLIPALFGNGQRKFILAAFASVCAVVLCWFGRLHGGEWVTAQSIILGLYKTANIVDKKLGGAG